jgi:hypothetical protein
VFFSRFLPLLVHVSSLEFEDIKIFSCDSLAYEKGGGICVMGKEGGSEGGSFEMSDCSFLECEGESGSGGKERGE